MKKSHGATQMKTGSAAPQSRCRGKQSFFCLTTYDIPVSKEPLKIGVFF